MSASLSPIFVDGELERLFVEALEMNAEERMRLLEDLGSQRPGLAAQLLALLAADERNRDGAIEPAMPQTFSEQVPRRIGSYVVLSLIGEGSVGAVFEARQSSTGRICAVKLLRPGLETPAWRRRFQREAEFLGRLNHGGIAQVYDAGLANVEYNDGTQATRFYLAMEFVRGCNASQYVKRECPALKARVELVEQVSRAVHHAHEAGLIHRDLKPDNIMIGEGGEVKVVDFGIGRLIANDSAANVTGLLVGTPGYVSPEQVAGLRERVDTRADVYALGATLYALITGGPPSAPHGTSLRSAVPGMDRRLDAIVQKSLAGKPENRYASAAQFADDLRRWRLGEPISARPALLDGIRRWCRRNPATAWTVLAALAVALAGCVAIEIQPEWRYQMRARWLPAAKIPVEIVGFDSTALPPELAPLAGRLVELFNHNMAAGGLFAPHVRIQAEGDGIRKGSVDLLSERQIAAFRTAGVRTILTGDFDATRNDPWAPVQVRVRLVDTTDGRAMWTGMAQGSTAEIPALAAQLSRGMQEILGGREQAIRRQREAPAEAVRLAAQGLADWLRFDLIKARIELEQAANLNIGSAPIRLALARAIYDLGYRDLARNEVAAALRLAVTSEGRRDAEALEQEFAANWPRALELRQGAAATTSEKLSLADDLIARKKYQAAGDFISRQLTAATPGTGRNRWLLMRARLLRETPGRHGHLADSAKLLETARTSGPPLFVAEALDKRSESLVFAGQRDLSWVATEESRKIFAQEGHREGMIREMAVVGQRLQVGGSTAEAIRVLEQALRAVDGAGFDDTEHYVTNLLGQAYGRGYDLDLARQMLTRALAISWKSRDSDRSRMDRSRLGMVYRDLGQLDESRSLLKESLFPTGERPEDQARVMNALGETELLAGHAKAALEAAQRAEELAIVARTENVQMDALAVRAQALLMEGDGAKLDDDFARVVESARKLGMVGSLASAEFEWGQSLLIEDRPAAARDHLREAVGEYQRIDRPAFLGQAHALLAIALEKTSQVKEAARETAAAQALAKGTSFAYTRVLADYAQAELDAARGKKGEAAAIARIAITEAENFGFEQLAARIRNDF